MNAAQTQENRRRRSQRPDGAAEPTPVAPKKRASAAPRPHAALTLLESIPMIDDTSDAHDHSCDWPDAQYEAQATPAASELAWTVKHLLRGAPGIEKLLKDGSAAFCVEARCAESLHMSVEVSSEPATVVSLAPHDVGAGTVHLWPGVVTAKECNLDPAGTPWGDNPIRLLPGRYLVRGAPIRVEHRGSDPMLFADEPEMEPETAVSIKLEERGQDSRFVVRARPDRIDRLKFDEASLLACWATALAMMPAHDCFKIEEDDAGHMTVPESQVGDLILRRLQSDRPELALWDSNDWDPMLAASTFVPLIPRPTDTPDE